MENIDKIFLAALTHYFKAEKSQTAFAAKVGISVQHVSNLLKGRKTCGDKTKRKIALVLGFPESSYEQFLDAGRAILAGRDPDAIVEDWVGLTGDDLRERGFITVPFSDNMKLAAGSGGTIPITDEVEKSKVIIHGPSLGRRSSRNLQAFRVGGDSMFPILDEGGIVLVDLSDNDPVRIKDGKIYVLCWDLDDGECAVKYLRRADNGKSVVIWSRNGDLYPPIVKPIRDIQLIGRVIFSWREH
jgi:transcriptional regulator with XRE-family HTH domain